MSKKKPNKPTSPFGYISFGKDGSVEKKMFHLSNDKEQQERNVINLFLTHFPNKLSNLNIQNIIDLPEADQDFLLETTHGNITVQITEIVEREYTFEMTEEEFHSAKYTETIYNSPGSLPLAVDQNKRDNALSNAIKKKALKNYAKGQSERLWLVIFSTSMYLTISMQTKHFINSPVYANAVNYIKTDGVEETFDEIWYFDLKLRPMRIWPPEEK